MVLFYTYRVKRAFSGGAVARVANYFIAAAVIAFALFGMKVALDFANFAPETYLVSLRDLATAVVLVILLLGLRALARFWSSMSPR